MRTVTHDVAHQESTWTQDVSQTVESVFDGLAPNWDAQFPSEMDRLAPLADAIDRGGRIQFGVAADVGAGTAVSSRYLQSRFETVLAFDLSFQMLRLGSSDIARVHADAGRLPLPANSLDAVVLMNAFLFPHEVERVLNSTGSIIWVSSLGSQTPIYLPPEEILDVLPGDWAAVASQCGIATWVLFTRL